MTNKTIVYMLKNLWNKFKQLSIMKKILIALALILPFGAAVAFTGGDKVIGKGQLPAQAQSFLNEHFADAKISYVKHDTDFLDRAYEVMLADGTKIEFSQKGNWEEVDCRYSEVPAAVIPVPIAKFVAENHPDARILKIERDRRGYEVKLSNRVELSFNNGFELVDFGD